MITLYPKRVPFYSVIIPTFNRAALLPRALESLLLQAETDWEAIICDDGSFDSTFTVAQDYCSRNPNIRYLYHSNRGTGLTRNAGIIAACGMFVTFLDSDDEYLPEHLSIRKEILWDYPEVDLLHGGAEIIGNPFVADKDNPKKQVHLSKCVIGGTFVIKRTSAIDIGGFSALRYADDADFFARAQEVGLTIGETDAATYRYYRDTSDSLCSTQT